MIESRVDVMESEVMKSRTLESRVIESRVDVMESEVMGLERWSLK